MREIKFRVWDKELKHMHVCGTSIHDSMIFLGHNCQCVYYNLQNGDGSSEKGNYILMQCTGLKDKNGKEIYEGDIVELKAENGCCNMLGKIIYDDYDLAFELIDEEGNQEALWYTEQELEVIGNIYDNPELLEED